MTTNKIITCHNILNPLDRTVRTGGNYKNIDEILKDLKYDNEIYDLVISKNSVIQDGFFEVESGDVVNISIVPKGGGGGGGKGILKSVMMVVVAIASVYTGGAVGAAYGTMYGAMAAVAVSVAGSLLVNALMPTPKPSFDFNKQDFRNSQAYGWSKPTNQAMQSQAIPKIFGTHKITPPLIASYVEAVDDKQYFNGLYAVSDGVINAITDIKINNEDIANFKGVSYEIRSGETTQAIIEHFNDTPYDKGVGKKLNPNGEHALSQTDGNAVTSLTATLLMPRGLWYANDNGGLDGYSISVTVEYSVDNKTWISFSQSPVTISGASTASFRKTLKADNLPANRYYVRAKFNSAPNTGSRYGSDCYLEYVTETTKDDFIYPGTALLAVRALATDQLSGNAPTITCVVSANSSNPAEVAEQILIDSGVEPSRIMPSFKEWAKFCNEKKLTCNIVFDSEVSVKKALDTVSLLGRASVLQAGSKFDVIIEKAEILPVQSFLFGMGNILSGTFKQSFLPLVDRANFVEITYYDKNKEYEASIVSVGARTLDNSRMTSKTSVTLIGCTDEEQAKSYGRFLLNCNQYLTETIEFEADKDSLVCRYGDVIRVSHDVPQYGFSGRLEADSAGNILTLDRNLGDFVLKDTAVYAIQIKNDVNEVKEYQILEFIAPNKIRVNLNGAVYKRYDNYALGEVNKVSKLYRIIKISIGGEFTRHITAIEYNEDVYNDRDTIRTQNGSSLGLSNLRVTENLRLENKTIETYLSLAWRGSSLSYLVKVKGGGKELAIKTNDSFCDVKVKDNVTYKISISDTFGNSVSCAHKVVGKLAPPPRVQNLKATETRDEWGLSWSYDDRPIDFKEFEIYKDGALVGATTNLSASVKKDAQNLNIRVIAIDTSNIRSAEAGLSLTATPPPNIAAFGTIYKENKLHAYWNEAGKDLYYELRKGVSWDNAYKVADTKGLTAGLNFNGTYLIKSYYENAYGLKVYSVQAKTLIVDENRLDINVMEIIAQPAWDGTHNNTQISNNGLCLIGDYTNANIVARKLSALSGNYDVKKIVTLSSEKLCKISAFLDVSGLALNSVFDSFSNVDKVENVDGANENDFTARLQISLSKDGVSWAAYKDFESGEYIGKAFKFRVALTAKMALITPFINALNILIDMPDVIESESGVSAANGVVNIKYKNDFSVAPKVQITIIDARSGDDAILTNQTDKGFMIKIIDKNGASVRREFNYIAKGY